MNRRKEFLALLFGDFLAINIAWFVYYWLRVNSGWFVTVGSDITPAQLVPTSFLVYGYWMIAFAFFGLYRSWYVRPPFDEIVTIVKTISIGTVLLAVALWWDPVSNEYTPERNDTRLLAFSYWGVIISLVTAERLIIRMFQRRLLEAGIGTRSSIIIGDPIKAADLASRVAHYPRLGYDVIGFVTPDASADVAAGVPPTAEGFVVTHRNGTVKSREVKRLGKLDELEEVIEQNDVKEVLIALGSNEHDALIDVIARASKSNAGLKIVPDLYDIISGQARTREIYGFPLIDINPVLLRPWEEAAKRTLDIIISAAVIVIGMPVWLLIAAVVKLSSRGPAIYSQHRVGKDGRDFKIYKFRSMAQDAEKSGPVWALKNDPRVTPFGRFLRKSHLDEVPQFWNVLKGDMSLVGPRPERDVFVKKLINEIPYYNRRHKVRPGITGLCQAMLYKYDENLEDVKNKVKYDLMYIESMSFRFDIKILFWTAYKMLKHRGHT